VNDGDAYEWYVISISQGMWSNQSTHQHFSVTPPVTTAPPAVAELYWPLDRIEFGPAQTQVELGFRPGDGNTRTYNVRVVASDGSQGPMNLNNCGVPGLWVCQNDVPAAGGATRFAVPLNPGVTYVWWVHACSSPGVCSTSPARTFTVDSTPRIINTLGYLVADKAAYSPGNGPSRFMTAPGQNKMYHTLLSPQDFEIWTWDSDPNGYLYVYEDHGQRPVRITNEPFLKLNMGLGEPLPTSGTIYRFDPTPDESDCTPDAMPSVPWSNVMTLEGIVPGMAWGGDVGTVDVLVVRNQWDGAFERSYYAAGWSLIGFEAFSAGDVFPGSSVMFTENGDSRSYLPGSGCTETHHATIAAVNVPAQMNAGQTYPVSVTLVNTGTRVWTSGLGYSLGSVGDSLTFGTGRVALDPGESIGQGQSKTFTWNVTAPSASGTYAFNWQMVQTAWFGDITQAQVTVTGGTQTGGGGGGGGGGGFGFGRGFGR
jgi:hypothetical protein